VVGRWVLNPNGFGTFKENLGVSRTGLTPKQVRVPMLKCVEN
jgi:hypothetical protein